MQTKPTTTTALQQEQASRRLGIALWTGPGTSFAYIHTGLFGHAVNGTTLAISKKGSGLSNIINPCLRQYMQTQDYYNVCSTHGLASSCYSNSFFPTNNAATPT